MNFIISSAFVFLLVLITYIPYMIFMAIFAVIIWAIVTKKIASKGLKILIIMVALLYGVVIIGSFKTEKVDDSYIEMKEMDDNGSLIGLSSEEVIEILGEPEYKYDGKKGLKYYQYYAGKIYKESYWGYSYSTDYYDFYIDFDENDKVNNTSMKLIP